MMSRCRDARGAPAPQVLSPRAIAGAVQHLRACGADVVHLHTGRANWVGGLAAAWLGRPAITTRRMDRRVRRGPRTQLLYRGLVERAAAISPAVARRLAEGGVPSSITRVIPSAVDAASLRPRRRREEIRDSLGCAREAPCALVLAKLVHRKGIDLLLRAIATGTPQDAVFWIAGEGPQRKALESSAAELGIEKRVHFLGRRHDVGDLLEACDLLVVPSRQEGLGVAALEAMARGRPVVASAVGGLAEAVVHEGTGLLVAPEDITALRDALQRLMTNPGLREQLGAAGPPRIAATFSPEAMVRAYEALYLEAIRDGAK